MMVAADDNGQSEGDNRKHWYAFYTKPHKEYLVQEVLRGNGIETYLPQVATVVQRRDRRRMKPFLPQYLFASLDIGSQHFSNVRWTPGLRCVVSAGGCPVVVPDEVVRYLRRRLENFYVSDVPDSPFKKGEIVRISRGPLEGLEAIFDKQITPEGRVWVFLKVMRRLVRTELDLTDILPPY